jgi:DNA-damage-inducible protein J
MGGDGVMKKTKDTVINVRISSEVKQESAKILKELGIDHSKAINIFLRQVIIQGGIPFDITAKKTSD